MADWRGTDGFRTAADLALRQFGQDAGWPDLAFDAAGSRVLELGSGRQLGFEYAPAALLVHLGEPVARDEGAWQLRAWRRCHHAHAGRWPVQTALRDTPQGTLLVAVIRLSERECSATDLAQAVAFLADWLDALRNDDRPPSGKDPAWLMCA